MTSTDSRLGPGTLTLGALTSAGCQMANVRLVPDHSEEDGLPLLCEPLPAPDLTTSWKLQGTALQDFEKPATAGFVEFARVNNGQTVPFTWAPNTAGMDGLTYAGQCQVRAVEIGGDVGVQITTDFEFPVVGDLVRTEPSGARAVVPNARKAAS